MKISFKYKDTLYLFCFLSLILLVFAGGMVPAYADEPTPADVDTVLSPDPMTLMDDDSAALFNLINSTRENPLAMAESLGLKRNQILSDLPDLKYILVNGLPALVFNDRLYKTAGDHTRDMLANNYYAYESMDGRTLDARMNDAGYVAARSGESLGMMAFGNFMSVDKAVLQMFAKMLKDELNPEFEGERRILNPAFKDLGVSVQGGVFKFDRFSANAYMATCDFGASVEIYELEMLQLINQSRNNPKAIAEFNGVDVELFLTEFPEFAAVFEKSLPPVQFNRSLYLSAELKISDMLENDYVGSDSPTRLTLDQRLSIAGYQAEWAAETLACLSTCDSSISPSLTVSLIFRQVFFDSLETTKYPSVNMLSEKAVDAGIRIKAGQSVAMGGICGNHVHLTASDFGASLIQGDLVITGVVFADRNSNDLYDAGEEVKDAELTIQGPVSDDGEPIEKKVVTNVAGGYSALVPPGLYRVSVGEGDNMQIAWIPVETVSVWQSFKIQSEIIISQ